MRGISPIVSYVLIVSIVLTTSIIAYSWALPLSEQLGERGRINNYKNQMIGLDYSIRSAAHGDVNFVNEYELHLQDATILLDETNNVIHLVFNQKSAVLGAPETTGSFSCDAATEFLKNEQTGVNMYRESNVSRVFQGSGGGPGAAGISICYPNINLQWGGECSMGRSGERALVRIKKTGFDSKPIVSIDVC